MATAWGSFSCSVARLRTWALTRPGGGEPELNIPAGVGYLKKQLDANKGDVRKGLTRYNGGGDPHYYAHVMEHYPLYAPALSPDALSQRYFPAGK